MLCSALLSANCGGELAGIDPLGDGGGFVLQRDGGQAPPLPECAMVEMQAMDEGGACVVPACADLEDPDQKGVAGGDDVRGGVGSLSQALSLAGCRNDDGVCLPVHFKGHKGGHCRHNMCADLQPSKNLFLNPGVAPGMGDDAVVRGMCFDRLAATDKPNMYPGGFRLGEAKTGRLRRSRSGFRFCAETQKHILKGLFVSVLKEARIAERCGHEYELVLGDRDFYDTLISKMQLVEAPLDRAEPDGPKGPPRFWLASYSEPPAEDFTEKTEGRKWTTRPLLIQELQAKGISQQDALDLERLLTDPSKVGITYSAPCDAYCP